MDIIGTLKELVAIGGISDTAREKKTGDRIFEILSDIPYFKDNGNLLSKYPCPSDPHGRDVVYGIIKGSGPKTVVLMGHYDVVGVEDYGKIKEFAFDIDALPEKLKGVKLDESATADLLSGEWIFGRGAADMIAGIAIDLWLMSELSKTSLPGNVIFLAVPDEESYSVGMRAASSLLMELKSTHGFDYELCMDSEPGRRAAGQHIMSLGTVGKCMPVVMVQGEKAHISMCFDGLNPLSILADIFRKTELSLEFSDIFEGERTMPPTWNYLRDMKYEYDVSLPIRAAGYFSVLSYYSTPDETMAKLKDICRDSFSGYVSFMSDVYEKFRKGQKFDTAKGIDYTACVMTFEQLVAECEKLEGFAQFSGALYQEVKERVNKAELNLPQATLEMMSRVLDFSGITKPLVLLSYAPPYYAPLRSNNLKGKEGKVCEYFEHVRDESRKLFDTDVCSEEYMGAMTDLSYLAMDRSFDYGSFGANTPLWGDIYQIDFRAVEEINIPGILFGPWGKDYHQISERVYRHDVETRIPTLKKGLIEYVFKG